MLLGTLLGGSIGISLVVGAWTKTLFENSTIPIWVGGMLGSVVGAVVARVLAPRVVGSTALLVQIGAFVAAAISLFHGRGLYSLALGVMGLLMIGPQAVARATLVELATGLDPDSAWRLANER